MIERFEEFERTLNGCEKQNLKIILFCTFDIKISK